jgi:hypothetical protein
MTDLHNRFEDSEYGIGMREGATEVELYQLKKVVGTNTPTDLIDFFRKTNGFDAVCGKWDFMVYPIDEILSLQNSLKISYPDYLPENVFQFGGNGADEIFLLDMRGSQHYFGFTSGIIGMDEFLKLGTNVYEFIETYALTSINGYEFAENLAYNKPPTT